MTNEMLQYLIYTMLGEMEEVVANIEETLTPEIRKNLIGQEYEMYAETEELRLLMDTWRARADFLTGE